MTIKDGDCKSCEHFVKDAYGQCVCEFDGECENMVREMTNEEWFCGLSTEEKAEFLNLIIRVGPYENEPKDFWECVYGRGGDRGTKSIVEWLKQPHKE